MTRYVLDYSGTAPSPSQIRGLNGWGAGGYEEPDAEYVGVLRYVGTPGHGKNATAGELAQLRGDGIEMAFVYEGTAGWMLDGRRAGVRAARQMLDDLHQMRQPYRALYFAADFDVTNVTQMGLVRACTDGAAEVVGRSYSGVYGEADVIDAVVGAGHVRYGWQAAGWSRGRVSTFAHLRQLTGYVYPGTHQCDRSMVLRPDWGQVPPPPRPLPPAEGFTVDAETGQQIREIVQEELREAFGLRYDAQTPGDPAATLREVLDGWPELVADVRAIRAVTTNPPSTRSTG